MNNNMNSQKRLRYVLYARKSTEDSGSQQRSIKDQIADCMAQAERENLYVARVIREEKSAKNSNNRPQFTQMIKGIEAGKYDGIISWHPDRLSRNSLEAGMIVDMIDNGVIKDLKFPTMMFINDSTGKMLLNFMFAISKQYSEHLSEGVCRAYERSFEEGKSVGTPKWGYVRDNETGLYRPDENFSLVREAWDMKLSGAQNIEILHFLRDNGMKRTTKLSRKVKRARDIYPNKDSVRKMFSDPFYYGILVQADKEIDLRETYDFEPMITEEEYRKVQALLAGAPKGRRGITKKNRMVYYPLRGMVVCSECGCPMIVGASTSSNKKNRYLYYRCGTKGCKRKVKNVRAFVVFDALSDAVRRMKFSDKQFKLYSDKMDSYTDEKKSALKARQKSLVASKKNKEAKLNNIVINSLSKVKEGTAAHEQIQKSLADLETDIERIKEELRNINTELNNASQSKLTEKEFLNLMKILPDKMENGSIAEKDVLARIMLLNCVIDNKNKASLLWKEPFSTLLKGSAFLAGAPD